MPRLHAVDSPEGGASATGGRAPEPDHGTDVQDGAKLTVAQREGRALAKRILARAIHEHTSERAFGRRLGRTRAWVAARLDPDRPVHLPVGDLVGSKSPGVLRTVGQVFLALADEAEGRGATALPLEERLHRLHVELGELHARALEATRDGKVTAREWTAIAREASDVSREAERIAQEAGR